MFSDHAWNEVGHRLELSGRELQIVRRMFNDKKELVIANDLGISPHTVHTHIERLYRKLAVTSRAQLFIEIMMVFVSLASLAKSPVTSICQDGRQSQRSSVLRLLPRKSRVRILNEEPKSAAAEMTSRTRMHLDKYGS